MSEKHHTTEDHPSLSREVFDRIDEEKIAPTPLYVFLLRDSIFWGAFGLSCAIGMVAVAASLFFLQNAGFKFYAATHDDFLTFFIAAIPIAWLLSLAVFIGIAFYNVRHTRHGYRYRVWAVVIFSILVSLAGGIILHAGGVSRQIEEDIGSRLPFNRPVSLMQKEWWVQPGRGLLAGEIIETGTSTGSFRLEAFDGSVWDIAIDDLRGPDFRALEDDQLVRVVGVPITVNDATGTRLFHACFMFPWDLPPPPAFNRRHEKNGQHIPEDEPREEKSVECKGVAPFERMKMLQE